MMRLLSRTRPVVAGRMPDMQLKRLVFPAPIRPDQAGDFADRL